MDRAETPRPLQMAQPQPVTAGGQQGATPDDQQVAGEQGQGQQHVLVAAPVGHSATHLERAHFLPSSPPAGKAPDLIPQRSHDKTPKPGDWGLSAAPTATGTAATLAEHTAAEHHHHTQQASSTFQQPQSHQQQQQQQQQQGLFGWFKSAFNGLAPSPAAMGMMRSSSPPATEAQLFAARQRGGTPRIPNNASPSSGGGESARLFGRRDWGGLAGRKGHAEEGSAGDVVSGSEERSAQNSNSADLTEARSSYRADRRRARPRLPVPESGSGGALAVGERGSSPSASARSSMSLSDSGDYYDDDEDDEEEEDARRYADSEDEDNSDADSINTEEELYTPFQSRNLPPVIVRPSARREGAALALGPPDSPMDELKESQAMLGNASSGSRGIIKSVSSTHDLGDPQLMEGNQVAVDATTEEDSFPPSVVLTPPPTSEGMLRRSMDGDGSRELEGLSLGSAGQRKPSKEAVVLGSRAANVREGKMEGISGSASGSGSGSGGKSNNGSGGTTPIGGVSEWEDDRSKTPRPGAPLSTNAPSTTVIQHPRILEDPAAELVGTPAQETQGGTDSKKAKRAERKYLSEASALPSTFSSIDSSSPNANADEAGSGPTKKSFFSRSRDASTSSSAAGSSGALSRTSSRLSRSGSVSGEKPEKAEKKSWLFGSSRAHRRSISTASSSAASLSSDVAPGSEGGSSNAASSNTSSKKESKKEKNKAKSLRGAESGHGQGISEASSIASSLASTDDDASTRSHGGNSSIGRSSQASSLKSDGKPKKLKVSILGA